MTHLRSRYLSIAVLCLVLIAPSLAALPMNDAAAGPGWWTPGVGISWQIQLSKVPTRQTLIRNLDAYDVDLYEINDMSIPGNVGIAGLHASGPNTKVICYFSAGSYENWRPDKNRFPKAVIGKKLGNWPGEWYIDIRNQTVRQIMADRIQLAADSGCDAVDPDNVDAFTSHKTGFNFTAADQLDYNRFLANEAHARGLAVGLKNDLGQIPGLVDYFDFAVNEQCFQYNECNDLKPFINQGKPVLGIEYKTKKLPIPKVAKQVCGKASKLGFSTLVKKMNLDATRRACPIK